MNKGLELEEDLAFQAREWRVERVGWAVIGLLLLLALGGVFGGEGLLSRASTTARGVTLEYPRFERLSRPTELTLRLPVGSGGVARLWIDNQTLENLNVRQIVPSPDGMNLGKRRTEYVFRTSDNPLRVTFDVELSRAGLLRGRLGQVGGPEVPFSALVYP